MKRQGSGNYQFLTERNKRLAAQLKAWKRHNEQQGLVKKPEDGDAEKE